MHVAIIDGIGDKSTWSIVSNMSVKSLLAQNISSAATPVSSTTADTILISQMNRSSERRPRSPLLDHPAAANKWRLTNVVYRYNTIYD
jgi:hypothetical protein